MENRFEAATDDVVKKVKNVIDDKFRNLEGCEFEIVMDTKKRKSGGKHVLVKLVKASPLLKHLTTDDIRVEGIDYILYIDKTVYREMCDADQTRIISHALYHADVDFDKDVPYAVRTPTVQTFYEEIADNTDDPRWMERLELMAEGIYERSEEEGSTEGDGTFDV